MSKHVLTPLPQVRGTPASGKSTLAQLLKSHICTKEPAVDPILIDSWPLAIPSWPEKLTDKYKPDGPNVIIIDEAQLTYWDTGFWNSFLKMIIPENLDRVILFASYGSPSGRISVEGTPMVVEDHCRVSLQPVDHGDGIPPAGLLLMPDEFADMVGRSFPTERFEADFLRYVFRVTAGHTGAVRDLLRIVMADDVSLHIKLQHSLIIVSSHIVTSGVKTGSTRWKSFGPNFLSGNSGRVSTTPVYSDVGSPALMNSGGRISLEFSV